MVRKALKKINGEQGQFSAIVHRQGTGYGTTNQRLLLRHVRLIATGEEVAEHLWVEYTQRLRESGICYGDRITFHGTVRPYQKIGGRDYGIVGLRKIKIVEEQ